MKLAQDLHWTLSVQLPHPVALHSVPAMHLGKRYLFRIPHDGRSLLHDPTSMALRRRSFLGRMAMIQLRLLWLATDMVLQHLKLIGMIKSALCVPIRLP
jgi:hypothetical protein